MTDLDNENGGYIPHLGMSYFTCPKCGNGEFTSPPQSVPVDYPKWTFEFVCTRCGHMIGLVEVR